jgi:hypothetical protein
MDKRPCCKLLRKLSDSLDTLSDPNEANKALDMLSQNCVLMKLMGQSAAKWDLSKSDCYLAVSPDDAEIIINEIGKTAAVQSSLNKYATILSHINGIIAHNAKLKQFSDRINFLLAEVREGERKFGRVPDTLLLKENNANTLNAGEALAAHPLLDKPQFEGMPPKSNPNPQQNPKETTENAERLQNQLQLQPTPAPSPRSPLPRPAGG